MASLALSADDLKEFVRTSVPLSRITEVNTNLQGSDDNDSDVMFDARLTVQSHLRSLAMLYETRDIAKATNSFFKREKSLFLCWQERITLMT